MAPSHHLFLQDGFEGCTHSHQAARGVHDSAGFPVCSPPEPFSVALPSLDKIERQNRARTNQTSLQVLKSLSKPHLLRMRCSGFLPRRDVAQPGRALAWGARGRQFKSARPDQFNNLRGFPPLGEYSPWRKPMLPKFEQFIRERQYLTNVSPATLEWYKHSLKWLRTESPAEDELKGAVLRMREKGLKATGCNSAIRAINAYLHWSTAGAE